MATADEVVVEFEAKVAGYERDLKRARTTFERTTGAQEARMAAFERRMGAGSRRIGAALAGIATVATAREFLRLVDAGKQIEAQLRLATRESGNFAKAQEDVRRIAMSTRTGLEETAQLYATFQRTALQLGITQEQSARATETVTKAFQISGATAAEAAGGLRQFLQGLQSGALRGEELNSVLENAPRLAKLIADSLGVTIGQLRKMGQEGDLAADKLIDALTNRKFTDGIDAEFKELPVTFSQAMQQVENAAILTFSAFDRGGGFSQMLANFITDGVNGFADLEQAAVETGIDIRSTFEGLANVFDPMVAAASAAFGTIGSEAMTLADRIRPLFEDIDWLVNRVVNNARDAVMPGTPSPITVSNLTRRFDEGRATADQQRRRELGLTPVRAGVRALAEAARQMGSTPSPSGSAVPSKGRSTRRAGPSAESAARKAEQDRLNAIRTEGAKQQELLSVQDDILAARAALATAAEDMARYELQQLSNEQAARLSQLTTQRRIGELTEQEYNARAAGLAEEMELRRQLIAVRRSEIVAEQQREALRQRNDQLALESDALFAQADIADTLEQRRQLEARALDLQQRIERSLLDQAIAEGKIADVAEAKRLLAERQSAETVALGQRNEGALGRYLRSTSDPRAAAEEAAVRELQSVRDGLAEGLADQLGTKNQFVKDMLSIFLDEVLFRPIAEALRSSSAGGGGIASIIGSVVGSVLGRDIGGPAQRGRPYLIGKGQYQELFVPQQNGVVVPNHRLQAQSAAPVVNQSFNVDARGAWLADDFGRMLLDQARRQAMAMDAKAAQMTLKAVPARMQGFQRNGT